MIAELAGMKSLPFLPVAELNDFLGFRPLYVVEQGCAPRDI